MIQHCLIMLGFIVVLAPRLLAGNQKIVIYFQAMVGKDKFACGQTYDGIGTTGSQISPRDFRFYIHNLRLIDEKGHAVPLNLEQDGKWQLDDVVLLDFENATGGCVNGTPETNDHVTGFAPAGHYRGLRFTLGVPFNKNHTDLTAQPPPLNLTALFWVWNAGHKFARLDFSSTGQPRGYVVHVGSTGCMPDQTALTVPIQCSAPNRPEVTIEGFNFATDAVVADLAALLKDSNVDAPKPHADINQHKIPDGCMSAPDDPNCSSIFANLGLPFEDTPARRQTFFYKAKKVALSASVKDPR